MMTISSSFCENNLQLLVTILERSPFPEIRANILIGLTDLATRFPNEVEPWTSHIYGRQVSLPMGDFHINLFFMNLKFFKNVPRQIDNCFFFFN